LELNVVAAATIITTILVKGRTAAIILNNYLKK
jgi:hypothetical protein